MTRFLPAGAIHQIDGSVYVGSEDGEVEIYLKPSDVLALLSVLMTALRVEGDTEKMTVAAKVCMSHLGRGRFE